MSFHYTNLGYQSPPPYADKDGYIPTEKWEWETMNYDHEGEEIWNDDDELTEYGEWWRDEGFPAKLSEANARDEERLEEIQKILGN